MSLIFNHFKWNKSHCIYFTCFHSNFQFVALFVDGELDWKLQSTIAGRFVALNALVSTFVDFVFNSICAICTHCLRRAI